MSRVVEGRSYPTFRMGISKNKQLTLPKDRGNTYVHTPKGQQPTGPQETQPLTGLAPALL